jgi:hypothetical protein
LTHVSTCCFRRFEIQLHTWQPRWLEPLCVLWQGVGVRLSVCANPTPPRQTDLLAPALCVRTQPPAKPSCLLGVTNALTHVRICCLCWYRIQLHTWQPRWFEHVFVLWQGDWVRLLCIRTQTPANPALPAAGPRTPCWGLGGIDGRALSAFVANQPTNQPWRAPCCLCVASMSAATAAAHGLPSCLETVRAGGVFCT